MLKTSVLLGLTFLLGLTSYSQSAQAEASLCRQVFTGRSITPYPLRDSFNHTRRYTRTLDSVSEIKDQCSLGTCHIHSWGTMLEQDLHTRTRKEIKISTRYLAAARLIEATFKALEKSDTDVKLSLGSWAYTSRVMIAQAGIIPDSAWQPRTDFDQGLPSIQLQSLLQNIIDRAKWNRDSQQGRINVSNEEAEKAIFEVFEKFVGPFPQEFQYEGKTYSPQSFAQEYFPELRQPLTTFVVAALPGAAAVQTDDYAMNKSYTVDIEDVSAAAKHLIDRGEGMYLGYNHMNAFIDPDTAIMSVGAFDIPAAAMPLSRVQRQINPIGNGHAVQIVGYDLDPATGKVVKWKIKNSWGKDAGDNGYFHMYDDYFRLFAKSITFYSGKGVTIPKIEEKDADQLHIPFDRFLPR